MLSYKVGDLQDIFIDENKKGNEVTLLWKKDSNYFELEEHISIVKSIEIYEANPILKVVTLSFKNMDLEAVGYLDSDIEVGTVVSSIGYCYKYDDKLHYTCKGGISRVYQNIGEITGPYNNKSYRMGYLTGLSNIKVQEPFCTHLDNIHELGNTGFYYAVEPKGSRVIAQIVHSRSKNEENKIDPDSIPESENPNESAEIAEEAMKEIS